jgi:hypothetical protein
MEILFVVAYIALDTYLHGRRLKNMKPGQRYYEPPIQLFRRLVFAIPVVGGIALATQVALDHYSPGQAFAFAGILAAQTVYFRNRSLGRWAMLPGGDSASERVDPHDPELGNDYYDRMVMLITVGTLGLAIFGHLFW